MADQLPAQRESQSIRMTTSEWIAHVDQLRESNDMLARGHWHGYTSSPGGGAPMRGEYFLVRWAQPTVAVSHDDRSVLISLATDIERAVAEETP